MAILGRLLNQLRAQPGQRHWMTGEVRELIDQGRLDDALAATEALHPNLKSREAKALALRGEVAFRRHADEEAETRFREALRHDAGLPEAHYGLSLLLHARRDLEASLRHAQFAINRDRTQGRYHAQLGLCHLELLNYGRAEMALTVATRLSPRDKSAWNNLGIAQRARGNLHGAMTSFERSLTLDPSFGPARANVEQLQVDVANAGKTLDDLRPAPSDAPPEDEDVEAVRQAEAADDTARAMALCEEALLRRPSEAIPAVELARLYRTSGDPQSGIDVLRAFLATHPDDPDATVALAKLLATEHDTKAAEPLLVAALAFRPDDPELLHELGDVRSEQDRVFEAGELYERAFELLPSTENKARLAANLIARCRYDDALRLTDELLAANPAMHEDLIGFKVYALTHLGRHDDLLPILNKAIEDKPSDPNRRFPRAALHLLNENFQDGWEDYRYRNLSSTRHLRMLPFPEWEGQPLEGKSIVVLAEQGLGDQVMFSSCLADLLARGPRKAWVETIDRVAKTLARSFPDCEVIPTNQQGHLDWVGQVGAADYFVPMGDLPRQFRRSRADFPPHHGYLRADAARVAYWRTRLQRDPGKPRIGISWRGGTESTRRVLRTVDIDAFVPLVRSVDADWVCLQYGDVASDLERARRHGVELLYEESSIKDLDEFAALVSGLDLVITVCNTTVHYAGALARPTWVLTPHVPEWRYGLRTLSLPWYPSTRILRQPDHGAWDSVFLAARLALAEWRQEFTKTVS